MSLTWTNIDYFFAAFVLFLDLCVYKFYNVTITLQYRGTKMQTVGIRELKEHLSRYLKRIKAGEQIIVTDRKKKIAILTPYSGEWEKEEILRLVQRGIAYWNGGKPAGMLFRVTSRGGKVSDAVLEDRR